MGTLRELTSEGVTTHLMFTNSGKVELYVYDTLKSVCDATLDSVVEVDSKTSFKAMLELVGIQPYLSEKWLFVVNYSKVKGLCKQHKNIFKSETSRFLVKVKNYKEYKEFKEIIPTCNDLYLTLLRRGDVSFLLNKYDLTEKVLSFVSSSYCREPEKIFLLKEKLDLGVEVHTQKDVVKLIGSSSGSVNSFVFLLLAEPPSTENGLSRVYKKRIQMAVDLSQAYGVSSFKNFITATVKDILYIKILYMQGIIFRSIRDIPECFDEKKLSRYNYQLEKIGEEIPYSRIFRLYSMLKESGHWYKQEDILEFIYKYYGGLNDAVIS